MFVARVMEITATSSKSFEDAVSTGIERATRTLDNVTGAWVHDQQVTIRRGKIAGFKVKLRVTFVQNDDLS
jgi:flavin-binding protein dodecin